MSLEERLLVDTCVLDRLLLSAYHAAFHGSLPYRLRRVPADLEECHGTGDVGCSEENIDRERFEEKRPTGVSVCPRHGNGLHAVQGAVDARQASNDLRRELHGVEVAPMAYGRVIVSPGCSAALGAWQGGDVFLNNMDVERRFLHVEVDVRYRPWSDEAEKLRIMVPQRGKVCMVGHPARIPENGLCAWLPITFLGYPRF